MGICARWFCASLSVLFCLAPAREAHASHLGIYFDVEGTESAALVEPLQTFNWYVIASDISAGIYGFEFSVDVDPQITVTGRSTVASGALNLGTGPDNWIVGIGSCVEAGQGAALVAYSAMMLVDEDYVRIDLGPSEPSSTGWGPAYLECGSSEVLSFDSVSGGLLNPEQNSWGAVKDLYRN